MSQGSASTAPALQRPPSATRQPSLAYQPQGSLAYTPIPNAYATPVSPPPTIGGLRAPRPGSASRQMSAVAPVVVRPPSPASAVRSGVMPQPQPFAPGIVSPPPPVARTPTVVGVNSTNSPVLARSPSSLLQQQQQQQQPVVKPQPPPPAGSPPSVLRATTMPAKNAVRAGFPSIAPASAAPAVVQAPSAVKQPSVVRQPSAVAAPPATTASPPPASTPAVAPTSTPSPTPSSPPSNNPNNNRSSAAAGAAPPKDEDLTAYSANDEDNKDDGEAEEEKKPEPKPLEMVRYQGPPGILQEVKKGSWKLTAMTQFANYTFKDVKLRDGNWYFVVQLITTYCHQLGVAVNGCVLTEGVGDDPLSWGIDIGRQCLFHASRKPYAQNKPQWQPGDYIGLGISINPEDQVCTLRVWVNGQKYPDVGPIPVRGGIIPIVSAYRDTGGFFIYTDPSEFGSSPLPIGFSPLGQQGSASASSSKKSGTGASKDKKSKEVDFHTAQRIKWATQIQCLVRQRQARNEVIFRRKRDEAMKLLTEMEAATEVTMKALKDRAATKIQACFRRWVRRHEITYRRSRKHILDTMWTVRKKMKRFITNRQKASDEAAAAAGAGSAATSSSGKPAKASSIPEVESDDDTDTLEFQPDGYSQRRLFQTFEQFNHTAIESQSPYTQFQLPPANLAQDLDLSLKRVVTQIESRDLLGAMKFFEGLQQTARDERIQALKDKGVPAKEAQVQGSKVPPAPLDDVAYLSAYTRGLFSQSEEVELEALQEHLHPGLASPAVASYVLAQLHFAIAGSNVQLLKKATSFATDFMYLTQQGLANIPEKWIQDLSGRLEALRDERRKKLQPVGPTAAELLLKEWEEEKSKHEAKSEVLDELFQLTGLAKVKRQMLNIFIKSELYKRTNRNLARERFGVLFTGNPGTGKTTVARLYARFLVELGALPKEAQVEEITGAVLGSNGLPGLQKLLANLDKTGGLLFVDEAYQLNPQQNPSGADVLNLLLTEMESKIGRLVVVFAGYQKQIDKLISFNEGLNSRFVYKFLFEDYSEKELLEIAVGNLSRINDARRNSGYADLKYQGGLNGQYMRVLIRRLARCAGREGFGNARAVENQLQMMRDRQVERLGAARRKGVETNELMFNIEDIIGPRPSRELLDTIPAWGELQKMIGLKSVKEEIAALSHQLQENYDLELQNKSPRTVSLNRSFLGNPGTGKTTVAGLFGQILKGLGMLSKGDLVMKTASDFVGSALGQSEATTKAILDASAGCVLVIDEAYGLNPSGNGGQSLSGGDPYRTAVIDTLVANVHNKPGDDRCVLMLGYKKEMDALFEGCGNPGFKRRFGASPLTFEDFTAEELRYIIVAAVKSKSLRITPPALLVALEQLEKQKLQQNFGNAGAAETMVSNALIKRTHRLDKIPAGERLMEDRKCTLLPEDFDTGAPSKSIDEIFSSIIGSTEVIDMVKKLQRRIDYARKKGDADPYKEVPRNFLFAGPPGTGKTTVARLMGSLFHSIGVLASSEVVELSASQFVTGFVGQAAIQTQKLLRTGLGKVLFIDEAYRLNPQRGGVGSFNGEVLDELTSALTSEEFKGKMVVILAGYDADIQDLLQANPGLPSRFPLRFPFSAFSEDESWLVLEQKLAQKELRLAQPQQTKAELGIMMKWLIGHPSWGNGRDLETLADCIKEIIVTRSPRERDNLLSQIAEEPESVAAAAKMFKETGVKLTPVSVDDVRQACSETLAEKKRNYEIVQAKQRERDEERYGPGGRPKTQSATAGPQKANAPKTSTTIKKAVDEAPPPWATEGAGPPSAENTGRDAGVDDATWKKLQLDKQNEKRRLANATEREKQEEEAAQRALQAMGKCPVGYEWIRQAGGYRCAGGSHFIDMDKLSWYQKHNK